MTDAEIKDIDTVRIGRVARIRVPDRFRLIDRYRRIIETVCLKAFGDGHCLGRPAEAETAVAEQDDSSQATLSW